MDFADYLRNSFLYTNQNNENSRLLDDFDASTLLQRQMADANAQAQRDALRQSLGQLSQSNAGDFASRGLLRSGLYLQSNDRLASQAVQGENDIAKSLSDLIMQRDQGRQQLVGQNNATLNSVIGKVMDQFNATQRV